MVYCRAGMSRSASLCIAYFMRHHNMTMDEAFQFVKEKRPIIHPNPGFVRQLKQFEAKLHNRRSGLKRKFEENDYSYAQFEECIAFEETNFEDLVVIKPRPKPRIMKPKLVTPENSAMPLEIAQSYCMTDITVCLADDQIPAIAQFVPSKSKSVRTKRPGGSQHGTKPKARPSSMSHPVRPPSSLGQPVRPHTPAGHLGQDNIISNWGYHDPMAVAESIEPVPMETTTPRPTSKGPTSGSFKKRPFSKISEPQKVAVSYQTFPWAFCEPFTKKANFHSEIPNYSIIADLHLPLAEKFQEITFECTGQKMVAEPAINFSSSSTLTTPLSSSQTQNLPPTTPALVRVRTLVTSIRLGPVEILQPVILECPGLYQKVNADNAAAALANSSKPNTTASASNFMSKENVPSRFSGLSTSRTSGLSRTSATRASIKLSPGVKISPAIPAGHTKRPVPNLDLDFRWVASTYQPPIVFERVTKTDGVKKFKPDINVANTILWNPMVGVACHTPKAVIFDSAVKDDSLSFKWACLLTAPKRSVICRPPDLLTVGETYAYVMEDSKEISVMPHREYPYYFRVGPSAEIGNDICDKATELPKVKVSIGARPVTPPPVFKPVIFVKPDAFVKPVAVPEPVTNPTAVVRDRRDLPNLSIGAQPVTPAPVAKPLEPAKPAKPVAVKPVIPQPVVKEKRKLIYEPQINWAATRCEFDPCTIGRESRPMEDRPAFEKAKISYEKSIKDSKYRSAPCQILDYTHHLEEPENLSNAYRIPEKYNPILITRFNCFPLYQVLDDISIQEPCLMVNMYCEPTPFKAWARTTTHTLLCDSIGKFTLLHTSYRPKN